MASGFLLLTCVQVTGKLAGLHFNVMPFRLCNATATLERFMETVLSSLQWQIYLDIFVEGNTFKNMLDNLTQVFDR